MSTPTSKVVNTKVRRARRLLVGLALAVGLFAATAVSASAAVTATFANGTLSVFGDSANNSITVSRDAAGRILVNGGAVTVLTLVAFIVVMLRKERHAAALS